jgi:predicted RNA binding protein YcfA (HicA-like mRNA interferase family)
MSEWPSTRARRVLAALQRNGWSDVVFAFHDADEIGPRMLSRLAKHTGLDPSDL